MSLLCSCGFHEGLMEYEQRERSFIVRESNLKEFHFVKKQKMREKEREFVPTTHRLMLMCFMCFTLVGDPVI